MAVWFDRIGLISQFLSFWLIAPEVLGEERMQKLGKGLARAFSTTIFLFVSFSVIAVAWVLAFREGIHWFHRTGLALAFSSVVLLPSLLLYGRFKRVWLPRLTDHLSTDEGFRRGLLSMGAVLLSLGTALQLAATFHP
jgi:hypothetical protein